MTLNIRTIDHAVVMASDMERSIKFYCDILGGKPRYLQRFRDGKLPVLPIQLGGAVINLQYLDKPAYLVAETLDAGTLDVCFRWDGPIGEAVEHLNEAGIEIVEGPAPRWAADGVWGQSVYFRDPDGNLLEFLSTAEPMEPLFTE
ncbi:MAG: bleomycin resistance protein [Rhodospirillaceae bacterium]|jgi:catechol 2,3-dioxygenase-like lactoylglutathione lyase family enzyme|nr:bleomycin resistance protein [Rhodospirillaceae bacterium]MBT4490731.1 bleomycin resistance protein [Rhodospirillaceae bacterium]MBT5191450.1 bleomycin resistance protein [Rhodospirillaceae bacterium]MBT5895594.1 bleomycin resistance protein [Rhodospirillaceae bacterium]MBT6426422.1 bleomycin resistance protein [Rhodospirillaceae bacterium]